MSRRNDNSTLFSDDGNDTASAAPGMKARGSEAVTLITAEAEPFTGVEEAEFTRIIERIGSSRVVLIGEASHGTSEFYRYRARLTQALIVHAGFNFVAAEADWPDAARINHYVRQRSTGKKDWTAFARFPTWMWRNHEVQDFVDWLHQWNLATVDPARRVGFYGLDLYSLYTSLEAVLHYLDRVDPDAASAARDRYGCLAPYHPDPAAYARAAISSLFEKCEQDVLETLSELLKKRLAYAAEDDGENFLDAVQNARLVSSAERYYRNMYHGYSSSWNLRDEHMFETLQSLLNHHGPASKAIVWEHNSHIGDAAATDMSERGQLNIGQLCRATFGNGAYAVGFGTHSGTVAAARDWGDDMQIRAVTPALPGSWEDVCHRTRIPCFTLPLRDGSTDLRRQLSRPRLERAIGVIYRPESERASHYFQARLAQQFDEYVWLDQTRAVHPLETKTAAGFPDTYPFAL